MRSATIASEKIRRSHQQIVVQMNGIQSPSSSQSPSLPQPSALAVDGVLNDTEDVLFVENCGGGGGRVKSHRVKTEPVCQPAIVTYIRAN